MDMKACLMLLSSLLFIVFLSPPLQAKEEDQSHHFKIKGSHRAWTPNGKKTVEYDPKSPDHLLITQFNKSNKIVSKGRFLFTGKEFSLSVNYMKYKDNNEIMIDGPDSSYRDGALEKTIHFSKDEIISQTWYYHSGQPQSLIPGNQYYNGEYKIWHPNGQLSFSGNYKNNRKDGVFEQFDESGKSLKRGMYQNGKLRSGEAVVMDITYSEPDTPAEYGQGENAFNEYLSAKAAAPGKSKNVYNGKKFDLQITFDGNGKMTQINNLTSSTEEERESIQKILKDCPAFSPATVENIPVKSIQMFTLKLSSYGIKFISEENVYTIVDESPEFPGGATALLHYLKTRIHYPEQALQSGIQGKVYVSFIVNKNGKVTNPKIVKGADPLLDEEALRVVRNMPDWQPGYMHEQPVRVSYTLPISFSR